MQVNNSSMCLLAKTVRQEGKKVNLFSKTTTILPNTYRYIF